MFESERQLQEMVAAIDFDLPGSFTTTYAKREVPVGECIPDMLIVRLRTEPCPTTRLAKWSLRHAFVISLLRRQRRLRPETIARKAFEPLTRIEPTIRDLLSSGIATKLESGAVSLDTPVSSISAEVIAVEAKLRRWRDALKQARNYRRFADRTFVALDAQQIGRNVASIRETFQREGIGLCLISRSGGHEWIANSTKAAPQSRHEREYVVLSAAWQRPQTPWDCR